MSPCADAAADDAVAFCKCMAPTCTNLHYGDTPAGKTAKAEAELAALQAQATAPADKEPLHPAVLGVLRFFDYHHLPVWLQGYSKPFHDLAHNIASEMPADPEVTIGLRKLREAKDVIVGIAALQGSPR